MSMNDTWKFGSLYIDAAMTIDRLRESGAISGSANDALCAFEESGTDFTFDPDYHAFAGGIYSDGEQLPLILIGTFGGYPGESLDRANADAAKEWASEREYIFAYSSWFGGCEMVELWYDLSSTTAGWETADEAVELAEGFRDYPVLDEDLRGRYEREVWDDMVAEMIKDVEEDRGELSIKQTEQLWQATYEYMGHWEEGYFPEDTWNQIIDKVLNGDVQLHQDTELELIFTGGE